MSQVNGFIEAMVEKLTAEFADRLELCKPLAGLLETTEISAIHGRTPGLFISVVGSGDSAVVETEQVDTTMQVVAYLLVVKPDSVQREVLTNELLATLMCLIPSQRWGLDYAYPAGAVECADLHGLAKGFKPDVSSWRYGVSVLARAADLYGGSDPVSNMALWAITWEQKLRLGNSIFAQQGSPITRVYVREPGAAAELLHEIKG